MKQLKDVLYISLLVFFFSVLGIFSASAAAMYQATDSELTELSEIFNQLSNKQTEQQKLLTEQTKRIEMLQIQLETSQKEIEISKQSTEALQTSLTTANQSLQESAAEAKRTHDRLKRQRIIWGCVGLIAGFMMGKS